MDLVYYRGRSYVLYIACHATTVEVQMIVINNDGHTFREHRSCPHWHGQIMRILSDKNPVLAIQVMYVLGRYFRTRGKARTKVVQRSYCTGTGNFNCPRTCPAKVQIAVEGMEIITFLAMRHTKCRELDFTYTFMN